MEDTLPLLDKLPDVFPVFPLTGALLLPGGRLPLNIFEPRYLAMTEDALANERMFAMIQPDPVAPPGATGPGLYRVGCLCRLSSFSETVDGRYLITLTGLIRFRVAEEMTMVRGYRRVRGDFDGFGADLDQHATGSQQIGRLALIDALRGYFSRRGIDANWEAIDAMDDTPLVTSLAMICPFDPLEQQALLEAPTITDLAETLCTLLRIDSYETSRDPDDAPPNRKLSS